MDSQTASVAAQRPRLARRNLFLVFSYLAVMTLIATIWAS